MFYWNNKEQRAEQAKKHTVEMSRKYAEQIQSCIDNTIVYSDDLSIYYELNKQPKQCIVKDTTDGALFKLPDDVMKTAVLNFASYNNPGGRFLDGSSAQEESLCHVSFLYNVLSKKKDYYEWNNQHKNKGLYMDRALYSPNVVFEHEGNKRIADVITCAAPNRSLLEKYGSFSEKDNLDALSKRIDFVRDICIEQDVERVILGAWGCGVFRQEPTTVAQYLQKAFMDTNIDVIYAIPDDVTYNAFVRVIRL